MMRLLLDTNVILDVLFQRAPWMTAAAAVWQAHDDGKLSAFVAATSLTNIFYVARRLGDSQQAHAAVRACLQAFAICPVDRPALELAATFTGSDFEDNLQIACAQLQGLDGIVTRDTTGFRATTLRIMTPADTLAALAAS